MNCAVGEAVGQVLVLYPTFGVLQRPGMLSELNTRTQQKQVRVNTGQHSYYHVSCETEIPQVSPTMKVYKSIVASNIPFSLRMWSFPVSLDGSPTQWRKLVEESWERRNDGGDKHIHSTV